MRILLVGAVAARARLRRGLSETGLEIAGEVNGLAEVQSLQFDVDAILMAPPAGRTGSMAAPGLDDLPVIEPLTPRELEVLTLLAEGLPNKAIAARLDISDQTVKFHVASIYGKLGASNRTDAVRRALRRGIVML
jgi:DNA-binding NarL/FixJ family response regulator